MLRLPVRSPIGMVIKTCGNEVSEMVHNRLEWLGNYALNLGDHNIKAVVGYTYEKSIWEQIGGSNNDFSFDNTKYWDLGSGSYLKDGLASLYSGRSESTLYWLLWSVEL